MTAVPPNEMTRPQIASAAVQDTAAPVECPRPGLLAVVTGRVTRSGDQGASAVEFALVVPILLLIVFGIINFGFVFSQQSTLNNAVREGARRAVVGDPSAPRTCDGIITSIKNNLSGLGMDPAQVEVKVTQDGFVNANSCGTSFAASTFGGSLAGHVPCIGSRDPNPDPDANVGGRPIIVEARYVSNLIAFPPFPTTFTLTSKGVYRCEFTN